MHYITECYACPLERAKTPIIMVEPIIIGTIIFLISKALFSIPICFHREERIIYSAHRVLSSKIFLFSYTESVISILRHAFGVILVVW